MDDVSHKVFNNMFIKTEYDSKTNSLIAKRKSRGDSNISSYMVTRMIIEKPLEEFSYETERGNFIGRNHRLHDAVGLNKALSNYVGDNLDPVLSLRNKVIVPANASTSIYMVIGFGRRREQIEDMIISGDSMKTAADKHKAKYVKIAKIERGKKVDDKILSADLI